MKRTMFNMTLVSTAALAVAMGAGAVAEKTSIDLQWHDHVEKGMIEQDVYVQKHEGSQGVYRVLADEAEQYIDEAVYTTAEPVAHDPDDPDDAGPHPKGQKLDMTLGDWLAADGSGTYTCADGKGRVKVTFENLVPNGVYTMWYAFIPSPPTEPHLGLDLPLGARDGSQNTFTPDAEGDAIFDVAFEPCLQLSGKQLNAVLAIAWHSDGKTYGYSPGDFGENSHVQLFSVLPKREDVEMAQN